MTSVKMSGPPYDFANPFVSITVLPAGGGAGNRTRSVLADFGGVDPFGLEAGDPLLHVVRHRRLRRLGTEAVDDGLHLGDLLRLPCGELGLALLVLGPRPHVLGVRAAVLDDVPGGVLGGPVEVQDPGDRLVEQVEVVADDEQRAAVRAHVAEEPLLGVDVEVVRRLVEAQDVAPGEQDAGELDASPLTTREHADRSVHARRVESEAGPDRPGLALGGVAARGPEQLLGPRVAGDGALVGVLLHGDAQLLDALDLGVDAAPGQDVRDRGAGVGVGPMRGSCGR